MNGDHHPTFRKANRLETVEVMVSHLIDVVMAIEALGISKSLWTLEEFNRACVEMEKDRKALGDLGHDAGMRIIQISNKLKQYNPGGGK